MICVVPMTGKWASCRVIPLVAVGTCKRENVEENTNLITALLRAWNIIQEEMMGKCNKRLGDMHRLATDKDSKRLKAVISP